MSEALLLALAAGSAIAIVVPLYYFLMAARRSFQHPTAYVSIRDANGRDIVLSATSISSADIDDLRRLTRRVRSGIDGNNATTPR